MIITKILVEIPTKVELSELSKKIIKGVIENEIQGLTYLDEITYQQLPPKVTIVDETEEIKDMSNWRKTK